MNPSAVPFGLGLLVGACVGAVAALRLWIAYFNRPENAHRMLSSLYARSHGHWLQRSKDDTTPVCPVCGFSMARGRAATTREVLS